jgi:hypothetical protein
VSDFISEDDLNSFEGWLKYQAVDPATLTPDELQQRRSYFDEAHRNKDPKMGLMKLQARPGEKLYGVAVRDDGLWLVLWVRRNRSGEFFVMVPRTKKGWDPHTSYHRDGTFHDDVPWLVFWNRHRTSSCRAINVLTPLPTAVVGRRHRRLFCREGQ